MVGRVVLRALVVIVGIGLAATAMRWIADPDAPSTDCISGGGTTAEAVICIALDAVASLALWTLIVGAPVVLAAAVVALVVQRRRDAD